MASLERALRLATLNVRGLGERRKQYQLKRIMLEKEIDILAVQETKIESENCTASMIKPFQNMFSVCVSHAVGTSGGCCLFVRNNIGIEIQRIFSCETGRLVFCDFKYCDSEFRALCIYAPNVVRERAGFFERVAQYLRKEGKIILLGDFNCVCEGRDRNGPRRGVDKSAQILLELLEECELADVAHCAGNENALRFTHFQGASHARLDRVYVTCDLASSCQKYCVDDVSFSDHCFVSFSLGENREGHKKFSWELWKFNVKLLEDDSFIESVKVAFSKHTNAECMSWGAKWELFKQDCKLNAIERGTVIRRKEKETESNLKRNLKEMLRLECEAPGAFRDDIRTIKNKLEALDKQRYRGATVRARAEHYLAGEAPTKRAISDEARYAKANAINEIVVEGELTRDKKVIEDAFVKYYTSLFRPAFPNIEDFKKDFLQFMPRLDDEVKNNLEETITLGEVETAIGNLKGGKSPGPDGLGAAFYKRFSNVLAPFLYRVFTEAFEAGFLPFSFSRTHTVLIPKSDDKAKLQSVTGYRPITLANTDYKVLMKIIARRLQGIITTLVGPHQTCGIQGRSILNNVHVARSVLQCCDVFCRRVAMLQIDYEKAFDKVCHEILFCVLDHVNVGNIVKEGIRMAYRECFTKLIVNKSVSEGIPVLSSVRQGCPASPLLFCIFLEPFCLRIINDVEIRGFSLQSSEVRLLTYADDVAVFCEDKESIRKAIVITKEFCRVTNSSVNWAKCVGFFHGEWEATPSVFENITWSRTPVRYLGVPLDSYQDSRDYWESETVKLREKTTKWGGRALSVFARATVCNLFLLAKLWYAMQIIHCSRVQVLKIHRVFDVFIWSLVWERSRRTYLFRRVKEAGVGLCHVCIRQRVNRFLFFRDMNDPFL